MKVDISKEQMIYESYVTIHSLKERIDRHSDEYSLIFDKFFNELKEIREEITERDSRLLKIETERNIAMKVIVPIISIIVTLLTNFFAKKL